MDNNQSGINTQNGIPQRNQFYNPNNVPNQPTQNNVVGYVHNPNNYQHSNYPTNNGGYVPNGQQPFQQQYGSCMPNIPNQNGYPNYNQQMPNGSMPVQNIGQPNITHPQNQPLKQTMPQQVEPPKNKKKEKKKKKHIGLWILLSLVVLGAGIWGLITWQNNVATEELKTLLAQNPIVYSENDYKDYVTGDIQIPSIKDDKENLVNVNWVSDKPEVLDIDGTVNRPENLNETVVLTAEYKKGLGRGKVDYELTVVKTGVVSESDIFVLSEEEITNGIGNNNLVVTYDDNENIESIDGSFGSTKVNSLEDALFVLEQYSNLLDIENIDFVAGDVRTNNLGKVYELTQVVGNTEVDGRNALLIVDDYGYLNCIELNITRDTNINAGNELSNEELTNIIKTHFNKEVAVYTAEKNIKKIDNKLCAVYDVAAIVAEGENISFYAVVVDANSKTVIDYLALTNSAKMVDSKGKDGFGNDVKFKTSYSALSGYRLHDFNRNIYVQDARDTLLDKINPSETLKLIGLMLKSADLRIYGNNDNKWDKDDGQAVSAYMNFIKAYDWYYNKFGRDSFDGKGKAINCLAGSSTQTDNAAFVHFFEFFAVGGNSSFDYPPCSQLDVIAHEYTHAVFTYEAGDVATNNAMYEGISEGYADIFGCLVEGNWEIGEKLSKYPLRDPSGKAGGTFMDAKYPETYLGANWDYEDGHANGIILSRAAYMMSQQGFSNDDIANIWYTSMSYGYIEEDDFLDVRSNVEKAARRLGYSEEDLTKIGDIFGELKVGEKVTKEVTNLAVDGDMFKDDAVEKDFLIVWSPIGSLFGSPILIYEEDNSIEQTMEDTKVSDALTKYLMDYIVGEDQLPENDFGIQFDIKVQYSRMPKWIMKIVRNFAEEAKTSMLETVSSETGQSVEETGSWFNLFFLVQSYHGTSYDFWTQCMGIDFSTIAFE